MEITNKVVSGGKTYICSISEKVTTQKKVIFHPTDTRIVPGKGVIKRTNVECEGKTYMCSVSEQTTAGENDIIGPKATFEDDTSLECKICKKRFTRKSELHTHIWSHTETDDDETPDKPVNQPVIVTINKNNPIRHNRIPTGKLPFECFICSSRFSEEGKLNEHVRIHTRERRNEETVKCSLCGVKCSNKSSHAIHIGIHEQLSTTCPVCDQECVNKQELIEHSRIHAEKPIQCQECGKLFGDEGKLSGHACIRNKEKLYKCSVCGKGFTEEISFKSHLRSHSGETPFRCALCGKGFINQKNLNYHVRIHNENKQDLIEHSRIHAEKPVRCQTCGKLFGDEGELSGHACIHTGNKEKLYKCPACAKEFTEEFPFKVHLLSHPVETPFKCTKCEKMFIDQKSLDFHLKIHKGKRFECSVCGKNFALKATLKVHFRVHSGEKPYECALCGKRFVTQILLNYHIRSHVGDRKHECSVCGRRFMQKEGLTRHTLIHHKQHKCSICGKGFRHKFTLKRHVTIHNRERTHHCPRCEKSYHCKRDLTKHLLVHAGQKLFHCAICDKEFAKKGSLTRHIRRHTGEIGPKGPALKRPKPKRPHSGKAPRQTGPKMIFNRNAPTKMASSETASAIALTRDNHYHTKDKPRECSGETNNPRDHCWYGRELQCRICQIYGHKACVRHSKSREIPALDNVDDYPPRPGRKTGERDTSPPPNIPENPFPYHPQQPAEKTFQNDPGKRPAIPRIGHPWPSQPVQNALPVVHRTTPVYPMVDDLPIGASPHRYGALHAPQWPSTSPVYPMIDRLPIDTNPYQLGTRPASQWSNAHQNSNYFSQHHVSENDQHPWPHSSH